MTKITEIQTFFDYQNASCLTIRKLIFNNALIEINTVNYSHRRGDAFLLLGVLIKGEGKKFSVDTILNKINKLDGGNSCSQLKVVTVTRIPLNEDKTAGLIFCDLGKLIRIGIKSIKIGKRFAVIFKINPGSIPIIKDFLDNFNRTNI
jgi:hypothetical protein